jgi:hypothetical protein
LFCHGKFGAALSNLRPDHQSILPKLVCDKHQGRHDCQNTYDFKEVFPGFSLHYKLVPIPIN